MRAAHSCTRSNMYTEPPEGREQLDSFTYRGMKLGEGLVRHVILANASLASYLETRGLTI